MMTLPKNEIVVLDLAGDYIRVACANTKGVKELSALGFEKEAGEFVLAIAEEEKHKLVHELIRLRALFSAGPGWSPAELAEYYQRQGSVRESFRVIAWKGPGDFVISEQQADSTLKRDIGLSEE